MFGYVVANREALSEEDQAQYEKYYCGVCHSLGVEHGAYCRTTLSYDMTFLALFLDGLNGEEGAIGAERCVMKPTKRHGFITGPAMAYAADMNIALTWHKCMDDWVDDRKITRLGGAKLFGRAYRRAANRWHRQCQAIEAGLKAMGEMERLGETNPDAPAAVFGWIMGELFVMDPDSPNAPKLRSFGEALGRFIYIMDAVMDLKEDLKKERYNPLMAVTKLEPVALLSMLLSDCTAAYGALPPNRNDTIIKNVLYSGVWIPYASAHPEERHGKQRAKKEKGEEE